MSATLQSFHQRYPHGWRRFDVAIIPALCVVIRRAGKSPKAHCMQQRLVQTKRRNDKVCCISRRVPKYFFYEDPCQNKKCACDAAFVSSKILSSKISGIIQIVALGIIPALCTDISRAEIILQRFISATPVRAHKASHVNEDIQQINIPMEKRGAEETLPMLYL